MVAFSELSAWIFFENDACWEPVLSPLSDQYDHEHHHDLDDHHDPDDQEDQKKNGVCTSWRRGCAPTCENSCIGAL